MTPAELSGLKQVANAMSKQDLQWQIANAKKLGMNKPEILAIFKEALASKS